MKKNFLSYAFAVFIVTVLCGLIYISVQQSHRSAANDPQLQVALDIRERLKNGQSIAHLMAADTIEISKSLAVFTILYNNNGEPIGSTGLLDAKLPNMPMGVFDFTRKNQEDVLTWQPRPGVRMAMVIEFVPSGNIGFVAVGRSLKEVEKRIGGLKTMLFIGWLLCIGVILVHGLISNFGGKNINLK